MLPYSKWAGVQEMQSVFVQAQIVEEKP
jgi:hypothetical protein